MTRYRTKVNKSTVSDDVICVTTIYPSGAPFYAYFTQRQTLELAIRLIEAAKPPAPTKAAAKKGRGTH